MTLNIFKHETMYLSGVFKDLHLWEEPVGFEPRATNGKSESFERQTDTSLLCCTMGFNDHNKDLELCRMNCNNFNTIDFPISLRRTLLVNAK